MPRRRRARSAVRRRDAGRRFPVVHRAQDLRPQGHRRAVRARERAAADRADPVRRRPRARPAVRHAAHAPDRGLRRRRALARAEQRASDARACARSARRACGASSKPMPGVHLNGAAASSACPDILNVSFEGVEGESLVTGLAELAVSTGSACSSATREPSYVLRALGPRAPSWRRARCGCQLGPVHDGSRHRRGGHAPSAPKSRGCASLAARAARTRRQPSAGARRRRPAGRPLSPLARRYFRAPAAGSEIRRGAAPAGVRHGRAGRRAEGTEVRFELRDRGRHCEKCPFQAYGCPHTLAVTAWLCEVLEGARLDAGTPGHPR